MTRLAYLGIILLTVIFFSGIALAAESYFQASVIVEPNNCGNGVIDEGEWCDGLNLGGWDCFGLGFDAGGLNCSSNCSGFYTGWCLTMEQQCEPTCEYMNYECGVQPICDQIIDCGGCENGYDCISGKCIEKDPYLIAYYTFDSDAKDEQGENDGIIIGNPQFVEGKIGNALHFDGNDYVEVPDTPHLDVGEDYSISLWINSDRSFRYWQAIFERGSNRRSRNILWLKGDEIVTGTNKFWQTKKANLKKNTWYHLVMVHNGKTNTEQVYIDGKLIQTKKGANSDSKNEGKLKIGTDAVFWLNYGYRGKIDDVRYYNKSLTKVEIAELYNI